MEVRNNINMKTILKTIYPKYQDLIDNSIKIDSAYWITDTSIIHKSKSFVIDSEEDKSIAASEKVAKSMLAMAMISQLMPYYGGAITDEEWKDDRIIKYIIYRMSNHIRLDKFYTQYSFLAFHTEEQRDNFIKNNEELVKNYLMID